MPLTFSEFFQKATDLRPYPYQERVATGNELPDLLSIPTGLGKTAAVVLGWLWRRRFAEEAVKTATPRRLVICLPMRVLVEQTKNNAVRWLSRLDLLGGQVQMDETGDVLAYDPWSGTDDPARLRVHLLMGGDVDIDWDEFPERDAVLIGTQDVLLSRALNRGYAMSRFRWPMAFGMVNNDCLWVMDEVQLMGTGLATTAQLQAFRDALGTVGPCRSLWTSATIEKDWLATVDMARHIDHLDTLTLADADIDHTAVKRLREASKPLERMDPGCSPQDKKTYSKKLAAEVSRRHEPKSLTLVIVNTVDRAIQIYEALEGQADRDLLLLHSRFRPYEREQQVRRLQDPLPDGGRIVISTQVVEAGVDLDARLLVTELAPWASLVQRFGRCNRRGTDDRARVLWIDIDEDRFAPPYEARQLTEARERLVQYSDVGISRLAGEKLGFSHGNVVRRKDVLQLFDTMPDLTGNDIDISGFIREGVEHDVLVFWRDGFEETPPRDMCAPSRAELCRVPIGEIRAWLKNAGRAWHWQALDKVWERTRPDHLFPGLRMVLSASGGGYDPSRGWSPSSRRAVSVVSTRRGGPADGQNDDHHSARNWQTLEQHTALVVKLIDDFLKCIRLPEQQQQALRQATRMHDVGKAHEVFQRTMLGQPPANDRDILWAKTELRNTHHSRKGFRHELASAIAALQHGCSDLVAYLVASHHGRVRLVVRSYPHETPPDDGRRFAMGILEGDRLPALVVCGLSLPETTMNLSPMELGDGPHGPSWAARMLALRDQMELGPFRLAFLESLLRAADHRGSGVIE